MKTVTVRDSINAALCEELKRDSAVFIMGKYLPFTLKYNNKAI